MCKLIETNMRSLDLLKKHSAFNCRYDLPPATDKEFEFQDLFKILDQPSYRRLGYLEHFRSARDGTGDHDGAERINLAKRNHLEDPLMSQVDKD
tara:strand:- start:536 stop:817 length:282 start_codon:yes stop_codon:yes gene_type:complete